MTGKNATRLTVSDNALLRWMERTGAIDANAMKSLLAKSLSRAWHAARTMSQSDFIVLVDGMAYVIRDDTVVTVLDENNRFRRSRSADAQQAPQ